MRKSSRIDIKKYKEMIENMRNNYWFWENKYQIHFLSFLKDDSTLLNKFTEFF